MKTSSEKLASPQLIKYKPLFQKKMKEFNLLFALLFSATLWGQCPTGNLTLTTQAQVDAFPSNYPGCSVMPYDLSISGSDIDDLTSLDLLKEIEGGLFIFDNISLTSLEGLDSITSIGSELVIDNNDLLTSLVGLENLSSIDSYLTIYDNELLETLSGLGSLSSIGSYLSITYNPSLTSLTALSNLTSTVDNLSISRNDALTSLSGLNNITSVGAGLLIYDNDALTSLSGLDNVLSVGTYLWIERNDAITSLSGVDDLANVGSFVSITDNDALSSLSGLGNISSIGSYLSIRNNLFLISLSGLNNNLNISTDLTIQNNSSLSQCEAEAICNYLASPNGTVTINNNDTGCDSESEVNAACNPVPDTRIRPQDCGITVSSFNQLFYANYVPGATQYEFQFTPVGGGSPVTAFSSSQSMTLQLAGLVQIGETWDVQVRAHVGSYVGSFATTCQISSLASVPDAALRAQDCGITVSSFAQNFYTTLVAGATQYELRFTPTGGGTPVSAYAGANRLMTLNNAGLAVIGETWDVDVRAYLDGQWGNFGSVCQLSSPAFVPNAKLRSQDCGATMNQFWQLFYTSYVAGATQYELEFTPQGGGTTTTVTSSNRSMSFSAAGLTSPGVTYDVRVRAYIGASVGTYNAVCELTSPGSTMILSNDDFEEVDKLPLAAEEQIAVGIQEEVFNELSVFPNPFENHIQVNLGLSGKNKVIHIYNTLGQEVYNLTTSSTRLTIPTSHMDKGIYLMQVVCDGESKTVQLVKS